MNADRRPEDETRTRGLGAPSFGAPSGRGFGPPSGTPTPPTPGPGGPPLGGPSFGRPQGGFPAAPPAAPPTSPRGGGTFGGPPPGPPAGGFGDRPGPSVLPEATTPVTAPVGWLGLAAGLEVVALVLAVLAGGRPVLAVAAWLLAGFGAIGTLAVFTVKDARRHAEPWYSPSTWAGPARAALAVGAVLVVGLASYQFAYWLAR